MQFSSQKWGVSFLRVEGDTRFLESRERGGDGGGGGGEGEREREMGTYCICITDSLCYKAEANTLL